MSIGSISQIPWTQIASVSSVIKERIVSVGRIIAAWFQSPPIGDRFLSYACYDPAGFLWAIRPQNRDVVKIDLASNSIVATWASHRFPDFPPEYSMHYDPFGNYVLAGGGAWRHFAVERTTGVVSILNFDWWIGPPCFTPHYIFICFASNGGAARVRRFNRGEYTERQHWSYADVTGGIPGFVAFTPPSFDGTFIWTITGWWESPVLRKIHVENNVLVASYPLSGATSPGFGYQIIHNGFIYAFNGRDCFKINMADGTYVQHSAVIDDTFGFSLANGGQGKNALNEFVYCTGKEWIPHNVVTKFNLNTLSVEKVDQFHPTAKAMDIMVLPSGKVIVPFYDTFFGYTSKERV